MKILNGLKKAFFIGMFFSSFVFAQLSGTYTIGASGDYLTFNAAVADLESEGVSGPVIFNVQDGVYNEQIEINAISGASEANQIVFQSASGDSSLVLLKYTAVSDDDNYVVKLSGGSYIIFKQISVRTGKGMYAKGIVLENSTSHIRFLNCILKGNYYGDAMARYHLVSVNVPHVHHLSFENCLLDSAGTGINVNTGTQDYPMQGIYITNNHFTNMGYTSMYLNIPYAPEIRNNHIEAGSIGIRMTQVVGPAVIEKNRIIGGHKGIDLQLNGYSESYALVANNFIYSDYSEGMEIRGQYINIYHNSLYSNGEYTSANGLYIYGSVNLHSINIVNNNLCRMQAGKVLYIYDGSSIGECRNNNLYTPGNTFAFWDSVDCDDLAELQLKSEKNQNTVSVYPHFTSPTDLHSIAPWLDGKGMPLAAVMDDIDGEPRNASHPDLGADEFTANPLTTTPLAGSYTVGTGTYPTIRSAIDDAVLKGISAPLIFNIQPGTYNEQIDIFSIPGAGSVNRVTLRSATGETEDVTIEFNSTDQDSNYVIRNFGADFISYEDLTLQATNSTYGVVLDLYRGSDSIEVRRCHLLSTYNTNALTRLALVHSADSYFRERIIEENTLENSAYAVYMRRDGSQWKHSRNMKILNNTIINNGYAAFYLQFYDGLTINENTITDGMYGIYCISSDNAAEILNNQITCNLGGAGIYVQNCSASELYRGLIANNFILCDVGASGVSGIQIGNGTYYNIYHNSVNIISSNNTSAAIEFTTGSSHDINIINNNFACLENGYAFTIADASFINSFDYNNLYSSANFLAIYDGSAYMDFDFVKRYSGTNAHSLSVYPHYLSESDLHTTAPWLDNRGVPLDEIKEDIDGQSRSGSAPDIGADEFSADPAFTTPLAGDYTIGSAGDYLTIQAAFDDALLKGVSDAVTFNILPGTYNEQVTITSIPGTSPTNNITLRSQTGDTSDVEITYTASEQNNNYVLQFYGADFINLENLKFTANGSAYARVIDFYLGADSIALRNNSFSSVYNTNASVDRAIIYSPDAYYFSRIIENNVFHACSYGIYMRSKQNNVPYPLGAVIQDNQLKNCGYAGMYIQFYDAPIITGNEVHARTYGIEALTCENELRILNNKISTNSQTGLYISSCDAGQYHHGLIANNFIHVGGTSTAYGMNIVSSTYQDILHNSVNITSTHTTNGRGININSGSNLFLRNNIFTNHGGGYAFYNGTPATIAESDYNDIYTTGTNLAYWNGNQADLSALQSASGMDDNSHSVDPGFASDTDLHIESETLDGQGTGVPEVAQDIDGQNRHPLTPDIGADEYRTGPNTAPYVAVSISDQEFDEDTGPHFIADLQNVFIDDDAGDYLTFSIMDFNGVNALLSNDSLTLQLEENYYGTGMIYITATDLGNLSVSDSFVVQINPVPDAPVAVKDDISTLTNTAIEIHALENDWDVDSDVLTIVDISDPPHGTAVILAGGDTVITYSPDINFFGQDTIRYIVQDETTLKDTAYVFIEIRNTFSEYEVSLPGICNGTSIWVDIDLDSKLDLFLMGDIDNSNNAITRIYKNGATPFSSYISFPGQVPDNPEGAAFGDFNNDGYPDLIITGKVSGDPFTINTRIYKNINGISFQEMTTGVIDIWGGSVSWIDYDLDGDQDLLVSGSSTFDLYEEITKLYRNDGADGTTGWNFTEVTMPELPQLSRTDVCWFDFDMDRDPDLLISGMTPAFSTKLLQNNQGEFNEIDVDLAFIGDGQWRWHDYDNDGDPDLFFSGYTGGLLESAAGIYRNDGADGGGWNFTLLETDFESVSSASANWLDFDNDGDSDIFLSGINSNGEYRTSLYVNTEGSYAIGSAVLPIVAGSGCAWGDFDNDGRIDVALTGVDTTSNRRTIIMKNNTPKANTPPSAPRYHGVGKNYGSMTLLWYPSTDAETPSNALTYNISIGISEDGVETVSPLSDLETGFRHIVASGNVYGDSVWTISGLTDGKLYYVRIQAIDAAYGASPFCTVRKISSTSHYFHEVATDIPGLRDADAGFADYDKDGDHDLIVVGRTNDYEYYSQVHSYNPSYQNFQSAELSIEHAYKPSLDWRDFNHDQDMDLLLSGFDPYAGAATYFTRIYDYQSGAFNQLETDLPGSWEGDTKFIDYDNDGDLDVMMMGHTSSIPFTYLLINDNGSFTDSGIEFTGLYFGEQAWCDYDLDGDLDVVLTGISQAAHANTILYRNDGNTFSEVETSLMQVCKGNPAWGDMDMDGDDDLLLTGEMFNGASWTAGAKIYKNEDGLLTEYYTLPEGIKNGRAAWGDFDNNGALDIIMTGYKPAETPGYQVPAGFIYLNNSGEFSLLDAYLGNLGDGALSLGDINGDNNLDVFVCGINSDNIYESKVFRNVHQPVNSPPQPPSNLHAEQNDSVVVFSWDAGNDAQTTAAGLTYNIRAGSYPGGCNLVNPQSDSSGFRLVPEAGNSGHLQTYTFKLRVNPGTIYWSVQSVDNAYAGSAFAAEQSIIITAIEHENSVVTHFDLAQNFPNPFNPKTTIKYQLPEASEVTLIIYNTLGQKICTLVSEHQKMGKYKVEWNASGYASGVYFYKLRTGNGYRQTKKLVLLK
ncbi:MAG: VCBS repeat-containing protein [Calditrichaceae bacterium]|nr:VCBS repeat-containing protein [Calditrichaceae bacterium]MBN2707401.1 VCBS repeat-containing protein [Calditrichaceae bacterium]RQV96966.1 MAG: T9SS C-terminal target domain-containing protein [Calditrichota bacterium]